MVRVKAIEPSEEEIKEMDKLTFDLNKVISIYIDKNEKTKIRADQSLLAVVSQLLYKVIFFSCDGNLESMKHTVLETFEIFVKYGKKEMDKAMEELKNEMD
jgi:hypothetical protein